MTDSFETRDDSFADAGFDVDNNNDGNEGANVLETSLDAIAPEPNGFVKLGLAKELLQAVADMGFTQPTAVQMATIPKAMQALDDENADKKAKFTDLLVSSQTGSGKTAAFLLPVLHTLLKQQEEGERFAAWQFATGTEYHQQRWQYANHGNGAPGQSRRRKLAGPIHGLGTKSARQVWRL